MTIREEGYYWCKLDNDWVILEWLYSPDDKKCMWNMGFEHNGYPVMEEDSYFKDIYEMRIKKDSIYVFPKIYLSSDSELACPDHCIYDAGENCAFCKRFENTKYYEIISNLNKD